MISKFSIYSNKKERNERKVLILKRKYEELKMDSRNLSKLENHWNLGKDQNRYQGALLFQLLIVRSILKCSASSLSKGANAIGKIMLTNSYLQEISIPSKTTLLRYSSILKLTYEEMIQHYISTNKESLSRILFGIDTSKRDGVDIIAISITFFIPFSLDMTSKNEEEIEFVTQQMEKEDNINKKMVLKSKLEELQNNKWWNGKHESFILRCLPINGHGSPIQALTLKKLIEQLKISFKEIHPIFLADGAKVNASICKFFEQLTMFQSSSFNCLGHLNQLAFKKAVTLVWGEPKKKKNDDSLGYGSKEFVGPFFSKLIKFSTTWKSMDKNKLKKMWIKILPDTPILKIPQVCITRWGAVLELASFVYQYKQLLLDFLEFSLSIEKNRKLQELQDSLKDLEFLMKIEALHLFNHWKICGFQETLWFIRISKNRPDRIPTWFRNWMIEMDHLIVQENPFQQIFPVEANQEVIKVFKNDVHQILKQIQNHWKHEFVEFRKHPLLKTWWLFDKMEAKTVAEELLQSKVFEDCNVELNLFKNSKMEYIDKKNFPQIFQVFQDIWKGFRSNNEPCESFFSHLKHFIFPRSNLEHACLSAEISQNLSLIERFFDYSTGKGVSWFNQRFYSNRLQLNFEKNTSFSLEITESEIQSHVQHWHKNILKKRGTVTKESLQHLLLHSEIEFLVSDTKTILWNKVSDNWLVVWPVLQKT